MGLNERDPIEEQTNVEVTEETHDHGDQTLDGDVEELQGHGGDSGQPDEVLNFHCGKFLNSATFNQNFLLARHALLGHYSVSPEVCNSAWRLRGPHKLLEGCHGPLS